MKLEIVKQTVEAKGDVLEGWTIEPMQDIVSTVGSGMYEELSPEFFKHVTETIGDDCWFTKTENGVETVCVGDPLGEYLLEEYLIVDGKISKDNAKPICPYCKCVIENLETYWEDHDTCDND